ETIDNIEHKKGYDAKYVYILRHVLHAYWNNTPLQGYDHHRYAPKEQTQHTVNYGALQSTPLAQYDSPQYIATVYLLTNKSPSTLPLTPAMFHKKGMPALSLAADSINSGKISTLVTLRSK
ncbi:hypothetical protein C9J21_22515, partial [Photobacterium phosphoreum]|uniref:hypothetical protein n=1 Tax=Photobacterium phosphoreum TaxID=659 RepID=UPI000D43680C